MPNEDLAGWVQRANASELAAFMGLAGARLVVLLGAGPQGGALRKVASGRLVSVKEAARLSGATPSWFYRNRDKDFVRPMSERSIRIDVGRLEAWLERGRG